MDDGSRQPASRLRLESVDGLRGLACLLVFIYHTFQFSGIRASRVPWGLRQAVLFGNSGVDIFIVLTGFCLFLPIVGAPQRFSAKAFFMRRAKRIIPAYYVSIVYAIALPFVLKLIYHAIGKPTSGQGFPRWWQVASHLFFVHTLFPATWDGIVGSYWSLGLEAQFYLLLPLIVISFRRWGIRSVLCASGIGLAVQAILVALWGTETFNVPHFLWSASVLGRLTEFGGGMLAAWFALRSKPLTLVCMAAAQVAPIAGCAFMASMSYWQPPSIVAVAAWASTVGFTLVGLTRMKPWYLSVLEYSPLAFFGLVSYSFYLIHQETVYYLAQLGGRLGLHGLSTWVLELTVGFLIVLALALVSFRFLESPFIRAKPSGSEARLTRWVYRSSAQRRRQAEASIVQ